MSGGFSKRQAKAQQHESEALNDLRIALLALERHNYGEAHFHIKRSLDRVNLAKAEISRA